MEIEKTRILLRQKLKQERHNLSQATVKKKSKSIFDQVKQGFNTLRFQNTAVYWSINNEVQTYDLIAWLLAFKKNIYLPVIQGNKLKFSAYKENQKLQKNEFGIFEPKTKKFIDIKYLEYVFVPLVGFDENGNRLGMGKGFYDTSFKFLNSSPRPLFPCLIGLAYETQKVKSIPFQLTDIRLNKIITENKIYECII